MWTRRDALSARTEAAASWSKVPAREWMQARSGQPADDALVATCRFCEGLSRLMAAHPQPARTRTVETADGRRLRVEVAGDARRVVVVHVGTPNAGVLYDRWMHDAATRGLTLVAYDRPGYGGSSPKPGRSVADCAADLRTISAELGFERCAVWGISGGGPHALACAALVDDLVAAAAVLGSPAPFNAPGFDFFAHMPDEFRTDHELFLQDRDEWERDAREERERRLALSLDEFIEQWSAGKPRADRMALHGEFGAWLHRVTQTALAPGAGGWIDDDVAIFRSPWGFDARSIRVPVKLWHGLDDPTVSIEHARWLAENIPGAQAQLRDGDGHTGVAARRIGEVHRWLAEYL
jgi:pimeloyl-ACP methyl ester carboxylesterase